MVEQIWRGQASPAAELADELAAMKSIVIRLPGVEPIEVVTFTVSVANRDLIVETLRRPQENAHG